MEPSRPVEAFAELPDPGEARTVDEIVDCLRSLKVWAGDPSYRIVTDRINAAWADAGRPAAELARRGTVVDCFKPGRRRVNGDLLLAAVEALHADPGYVAQWRQALRVVLGETVPAAQVRAQDVLPAGVAEFTGRGTELDRLRAVVRRGREAGGTAVISAIEGMAGVGKTQLAVHAGHLLAAEHPFDRVLFVNLRGFHPDPTQPPADPAAVLDSFLRLLGVPGQRIPHDLAARVTLYRQRLADVRALVVLDNAATVAQVTPLVADGPGCFTIVTSRRRLSGLRGARLAVDVFTVDDALDFLKRAAPDVPVGEDPDALARVARRCGHLPLALGLVAGQLRGRPGWTVTDHAERLDELYRTRRLDSEVHLALDLSYRQLPDARRRLFRLLALHPGHDLDDHAAAALAGTDLDTAGADLRSLCADHLAQPSAPGRYVLHDLVRTYAADRASDEDPPSTRRAALTRLFDHYLYTAATAMDSLQPAERDRRPRVPRPDTPVPPLADAGAALAWLDSERANLMAAAVHAAAHDWPAHATALSLTLFRHLETGGHTRDAITLHTHAGRASRRTGDRIGEAYARINLGAALMRLGDYRAAHDHHRAASALFREADDPVGEARAETNLGNSSERLGEYRQAIAHHQRALDLFRTTGDRLGEARSLGCLGSDHERLAEYRQAVDHHRRALALYREVGDLFGAARTLTNLGLARGPLGEHEPAVADHREALALFRQLGYRFAEAHALTNLGASHQALGRHDEAVDHHRRSLELFREIGDRGGEAEVLNSLGEALSAAGRRDHAEARHAEALSLAAETGDRREQARAHDGLAHTRHAAGDADRARYHWQEALAGYTELDVVADADRIRANLTALDERDGRP